MRFPTPKDTSDNERGKKHHLTSDQLIHTAVYYMQQQKMEYMTMARIEGVTKKAMNPSLNAFGAVSSPFFLYFFPTRDEIPFPPLLSRLPILTIGIWVFPLPHFPHIMAAFSPMLTQSKFG